MADNEYDPVARRAAFAQNFQNTTNLDQRRRFAQDISEAKTRDDERQKQEFEALQIRNPKVGQMVIARDREDRMLREGLQKQNLAERKLQFEQEKASRMETLNNKRIELQMRTEERAMRKAEMDLEREDLRQKDEVGMEDTEFNLRQQFGAGSQQYRDGLLQAAMHFKNLNRDYRNTALKMAGIEDPEAAFKAAFKAASEAVAANPGSRATSVPIPGGGGAKISLAGPEKSPDQQMKVDVGRLDKLTKERSEILQEKKPNQERLGYLNNEIAAIDQVRQKIAGNAPAPGTAATPQTTAKAPDIADPESFKKAFQDAAPGTILTYRGQQWRKP